MEETNGHDATSKGGGAWCHPVNAVNAAALKFGIRISVVLTASSVLVLIDNWYPRAPIWVYITVLFTSWFPSLDVASVLLKTGLRMIGTAVGAATGIGVGFIVAAIPNHDGSAGQGVFLGIAVATVAFAVGFAVVEYKNVLDSYVAIMILLTFAIAAFPFYNQDDNDDAWREGVWRIANVVIGCVISGLGALLLWPQSTWSTLQGKVDSQINRAGVSSKELLDLVVRGANNNNNNNPDQKIMTIEQLLHFQYSKKRDTDRDRDSATRTKTDKVHDMYLAAIQEWQATKALFPLLKYDPFYRLWQKTSDDDDSEFRAAFALARALRLHTAVILLDGVVRNDECPDFTADQLELLEKAGSLLHLILQVPFQENCHERAREAASMLETIRGYALQHATTTTTTNKGKEKQQQQQALTLLRHGGGGDDGVVERRIVEEYVSNQIHHGSRGLFWLLLEHLVLRALQLHSAGLQWRNQ